MDKRRIGVLFLSAFLLIPHGAQSTGRSLKQEVECTNSGCNAEVGLFMVSLVGGSDLFQPEPFMASLRKSDGEHSCGGTLIAPNVVLTAAHCIVNRAGSIVQPEVHVGRFSRNLRDGEDFEVFQTVRSIPHPQYLPSTLDNDIALLVLNSSSSKTLIQLASSDSCFESSGRCGVRLLGWGDTTSDEQGILADVLQDAFTTSVNRGTCQAQLQNFMLTRSMICAGEPQGGIGTCKGDSGGPMLLQSGEQVGIVSFGFQCAGPNSPQVYASVPHFLGWIQDELDKISGSSSGDCDCTMDGVSGGVNTRRIGCAAHLADRGDPGRFCMVIGGTRCSSATPSKPFKGAAWKDC